MYKYVIDSFTIKNNFYMLSTKEKYKAHFIFKNIHLLYTIITPVAKVTIDIPNMFNYLASMNNIKHN